MAGQITEGILAIFAAFVLTAVMGPYFIPMLHRMKFGQEVRDDGPQAHLKKQGTPTMGGIMFLLAIVATGLLAFLGGKGDPDLLLVCSCS